MLDNPAIPQYLQLIVTVGGGLLVLLFSVIQGLIVYVWATERKNLREQIKKNETDIADLFGRMRDTEKAHNSFHGITVEQCGTLQRVCGKSQEDRFEVFKKDIKDMVSEIKDELKSLRMDWMNLRS